MNERSIYKHCADIAHGYSGVLKAHPTDEEHIATIAKNNAAHKICQMILEEMDRWQPLPEPPTQEK